MATNGRRSHAVALRSRLDRCRKVALRGEELMDFLTEDGRRVRRGWRFVVSEPNELLLEAPRLSDREDRPVLGFADPLHRVRPAPVIYPVLKTPTPIRS